jgi:hypothetical protein
MTRQIFLIGRSGSSALTIYLTKKQERIRAVSKNIDLQIVSDGKSRALEDAEVIIGNVDGSVIHVRRI